jgi:hypothetical protein
VQLVQAPLGKYIPYVVRIAVRHMGDPSTVEKCLVALARVAYPANKVHTCPPASWSFALARAVAVGVEAKYITLPRVTLFLCTMIYVLRAPCDVSVSFICWTWFRR